ncbi:hypothetical protein MHF_0622 [Mycoplasma haemofelis Ohio2]|uniref:Uncharacterized protein n=1 Tax=Mycoplasma haemofelis (strain Ohio2) TaxID=859194 RepID=F6FI46_MYCHI|nr:hypothetical protein MHF_0622 [Mycoplasma haemofelis Ohio2]
MNKVALTSLGAAGIGGTALGGAMLAKSSPSFATEKYKHAVLKLDGDEDIWKAKYLILKESKESPTNTTLASAWSKSKESGKEEEAKALLRKGCGEIYNSSEEVKYLKDFKKFCAKTNKDVSTKGNWITGDKSDSNWNTPLSALKKHAGDMDTDLHFVKMMTTLMKQNANGCGTDVNQQKRNYLMELQDLLS